MIIDCISDLHGHYPKLDGGDLLIVAGDLTAMDSEQNWDEFESWIIEQKYTEIILVAGNHDNFLASRPSHNMRRYWSKAGHTDKITYLCDSGTEFEGLRIWGSPWTLACDRMNPICKAFTVNTEEELAKMWALIPHDIDILITHSPPISLLDKTIDNRFVGSVSLSAEIGFFQNLKLHVFGHIHEGYGKIDPPAYLPNYFDVCKHYSVNGSYVNERYEPVNKPIRIIL